MNNKNILYIPIDENSLDTVQHGYIDTLKYLDFNVYVYKPQTKFACKQFLDQYNINMVFTHSKFGIKCLPIDYINSKDIPVIIRMYPFNSFNIFNYNYIDINDEINIILKINKYVCYTHIEKSKWSTYFPEAINRLGLFFIPLACNILRAMPESFDKLIDVTIISNLISKIDTIQQFIIPLINRLKFLGYSYKIFGDNNWQMFDIDYSGQLIPYKSNLANLYSVSKVCLNINRTEQSLYVNDQTFMIPLCGGIQISNNFLSGHYIKDIILIDSPNKLINATINLINGNNYISLETLNDIANNHTYFNRLSSLFEIMDYQDLSSKALEENHKLATCHCLEIENKLGVNNGRSYEKVCDGKQTVVTNS